MNQIVEIQPPNYLTREEGHQFQAMLTELKGMIDSLMNQQKVVPPVVHPSSPPVVVEAPKVRGSFSYKDLAALPKYNGSNIDLKLWDSQIRDILILTGTPPTAAMAAVLLSGEAQIWWQQLKAADLKEGRDSSQMTWNELIEKLRARFVLVTTVQSARQQYRKLVSDNESNVKGGELVKFQQKFLQLLDIIEDISEAQAKEDFIFCMPKYLKGYLSTLSTSLTIRQMIEHTLRYNSQTARAALPHERKEEKKADMMDLGVINRERPKPRPYPGVSQEEHQRRLENKLCLCCGKDDHYSSECPDKPPQANSRGRGKDRGGRGHGRGRH